MLICKPFLLPVFGAPGAIRTPDPLVRSQVLYPAELRAHKDNYTVTSVLLKALIRYFTFPYLPSGKSMHVFILMTLK